MKANKTLDLVKGFRFSSTKTHWTSTKRKSRRSRQGAGPDSRAVEGDARAAGEAAKGNQYCQDFAEKLDAANQAITAKDYDTAIAALIEANQIDATRDVLWYRLGDTYRLSAVSQTDKAEKQKRYESAVDAYQKAIQLKQDAVHGKEKDCQGEPATCRFLYQYGRRVRQGEKVDDAVKSYEAAAKTDPGSAGAAYFNIGAVYTNAGRVDDANAAFDKCIAADPTRAEAYYQKGVNLLGKATLQGDKTIAPPGTAEAFQKYLEIAPTGPNAQSAKDLLTSIGSTVETSYGTKKKPVKK